MKFIAWLIIASALFLSTFAAFSQSLPNVAFPTSEAVADTYTVNITNYGSSYNDKVALINFRTPNGGPATLNITPSGGSALGARPLRKKNSSGDWVPLASGDIPGDSSLFLVHYSTACGCLRIVPQGAGSGSGSGVVESIVAGTGISVDDTDPANPIVSATGGSGDIEIGTTNVTGGTNTRVLYNNSGVVGEYVISGTGNVAMTNSPVFTTPNIGAATGSITGNAGTATALQTARNINGTAFDGTGNITVTAAAGTLTGGTLAAGVTASSLTSFGTIVSGTVPGTLVSNTPAGNIAATTSQAAINELDTEKLSSYMVNNDQTTDYSLVLTDAQKIVRINDSNPHTVTVPANATVAFPVNTKVMVEQIGTGQVTIAAAGGVTITQPAGGSLLTPGQGLPVVLYKTGTNAWTLWNGTPVENYTTGSIPFGNSNGFLTQDNTNFYFNNASNLLGVGLNTPSSTLHVTGSVAFTPCTYDSNSSLDAGCAFILADATAGTITLTLPAVAGVVGRRYFIKKINSANTVSIDPNGSETIDGSSTTVNLTTQWSKYCILATSAGWILLDN